MFSSPGNRGFTVPSDAGSCLPGPVSAQLRPGRQHGEADGENSPPPRCLPDEIPVTLDDREPAAVALAARPQAPGPDLAAFSCHPPCSSPGQRRRQGAGRNAPSGVYPALPYRLRPITRRVYQGRDPLYPAAPGRAPSGNRRLSPASEHHLPRAERSTTPSATTVC